MSSVRLLRGTATRLDGRVSEDFELLSAGTIDRLPAVTGTGGCSLDVGISYPRV